MGAYSQFCQMTETPGHTYILALHYLRADCKQTLLAPMRLFALQRSLQLRRLLRCMRLMTGFGRQSLVIHWQSVKSPSNVPAAGLTVRLRN